LHYRGQLRRSNFALLLVGGPVPPRRGAMRADEEWGSSSVLKQGKRASRSSGAAGSSVSFNGNASRRSAASTVGRSSVSEDVRRSNGEEPLGIAELGPPARPHTSLGQRADLERPAGYIVPKVFNEKDFQAFLARQKTRSAGGRLNELVGSLQKAMRPQSPQHGMLGRCRVAPDALFAPFTTASVPSDANRYARAAAAARFRRACPTRLQRPR
jgi:hypothetical protein